jgi:hypothetical protein
VILSSRTRILAVLAVFLAAYLVVPTAGAADLTPHRAEYKVKISIVSGQLNTELRAIDSGYVAKHGIKAVGMSRILTRGTMRVSSEFMAGTDGVMPVKFHEVDTIKDDPEVRLSFDWTTNVASGTVGKEDVTIQLDGVSHDNVSIQYALMHDLLNGQPKETYVLFDVDKMRVAHVRNIGTKKVKTKAGNYEVVGIQHQKEGSSRVTTLWCAPELGYLPVIIEQHRKKKLNFRATLTKYAAT